MGWFSKQKEMDDQTKPATRSARKQCWESRDEYFKCLDKINVVNALDPKNADMIKSHCKAEETKFDQDCATSWIKYFKEKRVVDIKKEKMLQNMEKEGAQLVNLGFVPPSAPK
ncbi:HDL520Cp [Eremothecium sinecaudum]|uniref:HDL520Cp n=1 Tax=Eremothecium sinecaudum TaxID=45286 RepID=A0A0X8HRP3_9SACH|nr:HDL520Cp [Eremothecium sinecaudum]AMD20224.1 HDL520Cp [Eremothecium sinecaudum]